MNTWNNIADNAMIIKTVQSLKEHNIDVIVVEDANEAKRKALELIPQKAEVMTMTSQTLEATGIAKELNESGNYDAVRVKLMQMDRNTQTQEMQKLGAAPQYSIGSVHAVTEDGKVIIASNSGSQLPGYAYGSQHVIWVVGAQKLVKNLDEGMKRIYDYVLPLESERAKKAYGIPGSFVSKLLIFNKEVPGRITMILVKESLGF
jgi:hypothetical protein